ncbi:hypothetical protein WISP_78149 [Willisornis vidua]|uniref:Uncharacterized protein n=1 Tax=Willisornis vidua TaxID=1566151 RepID=A0ABQ9DBE6_9PASS|nr:hypothetical protein WISP_78149 [Willisornis vidua]
MGEAEAGPRYQCSQQHHSPRPDERVKSQLDVKNNHILSLFSAFHIQAPEFWQCLLNCKPHTGNCPPGEQKRLTARSE